MLDNLRKIHERDTQDALGMAEKKARQSDQAEFLTSELQAWLPTSPTKHNIAKQIALECMGKSIVIYASPMLKPVAQHWKDGFNIHARQLAWVGERSPAELLSWTQQPQVKLFAVVELLSPLEPATVQGSFTQSSRMLSGLRPDPIRVHAEGETAEEHLAWALSLGDFVTIYTALLSGINPDPGVHLQKFTAIMEG